MLARRLAPVGIIGRMRHGILAPPQSFFLDTHDRDHGNSEWEVVRPAITMESCNLAFQITKNRAQYHVETGSIWHHHLIFQNRERRPVRSHTPIRFVLRHPLTFAGRVLRRFQANRGLLLAGAIAYYALLSLVPSIILLLVVLSQVVSEAQLLTMLHRYLEQLVPGESEIILDQVAQFLGHRRALGWMMAGTLLFFSSAAFGVLENALAVIFAHRHAVHARNVLTSLLLPYLYVLLLGFGLLAVTLMIGVLQTLMAGDIRLLGWQWSPGSLLVTLLYLIGLLSQIGVLTLIYRLMPAGRLPWRHALIGGVAATLLWEGIRYGIVWYFANLSAVNMVYGSLAGVVIMLMTLDVLGIIILLGAQVIAEYERLLPEFSDGDTATRDRAHLNSIVTSEKKPPP